MLVWITFITGGQTCCLAAKHYLPRSVGAQYNNEAISDKRALRDGCGKPKRFRLTG